MKRWVIKIGERYLSYFGYTVYPAIRDGKESNFQIPIWVSSERPLIFSEKKNCDSIAILVKPACEGDAIAIEPYGEKDDESKKEGK